MNRRAAVASEIHTKVLVSGTVGYACRGRKSRAEAVQEARAHYQRQLEEAQRFLAATDHNISVTVVRGLYRETLLEYLPPEHSK